MPFLSVCCIVLGVMIIKSAYRESPQSPEIILDKSDRTCTQYVTKSACTLVMINEIAHPKLVTTKSCTQWSKTGTELEE